MNAAIMIPGERGFWRGFHQSSMFQSCPGETLPGNDGENTFHLSTVNRDSTDQDPYRTLTSLNTGLTQGDRLRGRAASLPRIPRIETGAGSNEGRLFLRRCAGLVAGCAAAVISMAPVMAMPEAVRSIEASSAQPVPALVNPSPASQAAAETAMAQPPAGREETVIMNVLMASHKPVPGNLKQWIVEAKKILADMGYDVSKIRDQDIALIAQHESSGNPRAVNNWDSNAARGTPSKGLMQVIQPTFDRWAAPGHRDIWNPVDNIVAAVRYSIDRYGSFENVPGVKAMRNGGRYRGY